VADRRVVVPALGLATALALLGDVFVYTVLPTQPGSAGLDLAALAVMLSVHRFIRLVANPAGGLLYDRVGRRRPYLLGMTLAVASTGGYWVAVGFWPMLLARLCWGVAFALISVGGASIIFDLTTAADRGRAVGLSGEGTGKGDTNERSGRIRLWIGARSGVAGRPGSSLFTATTAPSTGSSGGASLTRSAWRWSGTWSWSSWRGEGAMTLNRDFRDLFAALSEAGARYLLVGGYAVAFHAEPRFTKDLDVWAESTPENAVRVLQALRAFGAAVGDLTAADLTRPGLVFQIGVPPNRIDVVTSIDGVTFGEAWAGQVETTYGDQTVPVIGRRHLIQNKRASGRPQDLLDIELLERHA
jgi:MFS family permease